MKAMKTNTPGVIVVNQAQSQPGSVPKSVSQPAEAVKVIVEKASPSKVRASVKSQVQNKNQLERKRRQELNIAYDFLREKLPAIASKNKPSKQIILDAALDCCRGLAGKQERLERIQEEEVERRRALEEQLSRLQSQN